MRKQSRSLTESGIWNYEVVDRSILYSQFRHGTALRPISSMTQLIKIRGARQHNLKNIDVDIPRNQLVVITGLSGSGKSTLAFDTLYAEGQRRYVESLSAYARQFLERLQKPDVDLIEGLSPAIAIEQKTASHNPRSTVGTVTEIYDYLRLLYARIGSPHCHLCGREITSQSIDQIIENLQVYPQGTRIIMLAPLISNQKGNHLSLLNRLKRDGFARVRVDGTILDIEAVGTLTRNQNHTIEVVVDRLVLKGNARKRLADSLELTLSLSGGTALIRFPDAPPEEVRNEQRFSETAVCPSCNVRYPELMPASFSFNSPQGACPQCDGLGTLAVFTPELMVPDPKLSLRQGAVAIWASRNSVYFTSFLEAFTQQYGTDIDTPFEALPEAFKEALFHGTGSDPITFVAKRDSGSQQFNKPFEGLIPQLERRYRETDSSASREEIQRNMAFETCPACKGARLRPESRAVLIEDQAIHQVTARPINRALAFFRQLRLEGQRGLIAQKIIQEIIQRLEFLQDVGLSYLTLDRTAHTLSGGESQRIRLATQIGARLTGVLYVLDEPSIGLHPRDNHKLLQSLIRMRDLGNTLLVVEHDRETIQAADFVIDMGPGAGVNGGQIVYSGPPQALYRAMDSLTGQYFSGRLQIPVPAKRRAGSGRKRSPRNSTWDALIALAESPVRASPPWLSKRFFTPWPSTCTAVASKPAGTRKLQACLKSTRLSTSISRPSAAHRVPIRQHTPACSLLYVIFSPELQTRVCGATNRDVSASTPKVAAAKLAAETVSSRLKCIFCLTFMCHAIYAAANVTTVKHWTCDIKAKISQKY